MRSTAIVAIDYLINDFSVCGLRLVGAIFGEDETIFGLVLVGGKIDFGAILIEG